MKFIKVEVIYGVSASRSMALINLANVAMIKQSGEENCVVSFLHPEEGVVVKGTLQELAIKINDAQKFNTIQ